MFLVQNRVAHHQSLESGCIPDQCPALPKRLRRCTLVAGGEQTQRTQHVAGYPEPQDDLRAAESKLVEFDEARGEQ